jgi:mRNA interferase RelE/StbE
MLGGVRDARVRRKLVERMQALAINPEPQGKALTGELQGCRSVRAVGQRYRIVYRVDTSRQRVVVVGVGLRKEGAKGDVYSQVTRQARRQPRRR